MTTKPPSGDNAHQVSAYHRMVERLHYTLEHMGSGFGPGLKRALDEVRDKAVEAQELTREEADRISEYVRRDLQEAAEYLVHTGGELGGWLRLDLAQFEQQMADLFWQVADRTKLELAQLAEQAEVASHYRTGEIAAPGLFECVECGRRIQLTAAGHIPPCPGCRGTHFARRSEDDDLA